MALHVGCRAAKWKKEKKKIPTRKREWSLGSEYLERTGGDGPNSKLYANQIEFILDWYLCLYFHSLRGTHLDTLTDSVIRSVLLPVGGIENTSMQSWCDGVHCLSISSSVFRTSGNWKWYSSGSQMRSGASGTFDSGCTQAHRGESTRVFFSLSYVVATQSFDFQPNMNMNIERLFLAVWVWVCAVHVRWRKNRMPDTNSFSFHWRSNWIRLHSIANIQQYQPPTAFGTMRMEGIDGIGTPKRLHQIKISVIKYLSMSSFHFVLAGIRPFTPAAAATEQ